MASEEEEAFEKPVAVLDSNVILDAVSCVHMVQHYEKNSGIDPAAPESVFRRQKAREAILLSIHLHNSRATTYSLFEATRVTMREIPPDADDRFENQALRIWAHYVKDTVLADWIMTCPSNGDGEPKGNAADALLVERAKEYGVPLVSNEGISVNGVDEKKYIRKKAREAGVSILTPRQFYGDIDELLQCALFMKRFNERAAAHIAQSSHPDFMREAMLYVQGYYRHVFYGITQGYSDALAVRVADAAV